MHPPKTNFSRPLSPSQMPSKASSATTAYNLAFTNALNLLNLRTYSEFEQRFLTSDAFLVPWAEFRDSFLLLQPSGMPRSSLPGRLTREGVLWMYTIMDEGKYRNDPDSDDDSAFFNMGHGNYGGVGSDIVNKSAWEVLEHEKHLFAWLLQAFRVGKVENEFRYFRTRNICSAFEEVFLPIVDTLRNEYDPRGRRFYGRFATFIESVRPSLLAFPERSVGLGLDDNVPPPVPPKDSTYGKTGQKFVVGRWMKDLKGLERREGSMRKNRESIIDRPIPELRDWLREQKWKAEMRKKQSPSEILNAKTQAWDRDRAMAAGAGAGAGKKVSLADNLTHQRNVSAPARIQFRGGSKGSMNKPLGYSRNESLEGNLSVPGHSRNFSTPSATVVPEEVGDVREENEELLEESDGEWDRTFYAHYGFPAL